MSKNNQNINFLQSEEWCKFQKSVGRKTFFVENGPARNASHSDAGGDSSISIIEHKLPVVGKYFYCPRGPVIPAKAGIQSVEIDSGSEAGMTSLVNLAKKEKAGWIRFDPKDENILELIKKNTNYKIQKAPHDMQPKEIFVIDISKPEEELLAEMKPKTRYNINLAFKKGVKITITNKKCHPEFISEPVLNSIQESQEMLNQVQHDKGYYTEEFLRLVAATAKRKKVNFHSENYYRKMVEEIPENMLKLYVAEYENKIIAANLVIFFEDTTIYLHGATDDEYRNIMAPYLLQWQAILDAKNAGYKFYDFGGISTNNEPKTKNWLGITKFKMGFSPNTQPTVFPGSYDIIINKNKYFLYRILQKIKSFL